MLVSIDKTPSPKKALRGYGFSYLVVIIIFLPNRLTLTLEKGILI